MSEKQGPTPGQWLVDPNQYSVFNEDVCIADCTDSAETEEEILANCYLIAAAPNLLSACKAALWLMGKDEDRRQLGEKPCEPIRVPQALRDAIAKAELRPQ